MVKGIEVFQEYFKDYANQYVLIGGAACSVSFEEQEVSFRATKDLDVVLIVEALTKEFGERFWQFIREGGYQNRAKSNGSPQFYRFDKPENDRFPKMIELFSRTEWALDADTVLTPIHIDDDVSSLSTILLDADYYQALLDGRDVINGISVLKPAWVVPFKAKAWLELREKAGVDSSDVKKHRNDIIRLVSELTMEPCILPASVQTDMERFIAAFEVTASELKSLRIRGVTASQIKEALRRIYMEKNES